MYRKREGNKISQSSTNEFEEYIKDTDKKEKNTAFNNLIF